MRATIPEEIKQARWIVKERQEMLAEAKREAERIVKEARERQERLVSEEEITKQAERARRGHHRGRPRPRARDPARRRGLRRRDPEHARGQPLEVHRRRPARARAARRQGRARRSGVGLAARLAAKVEVLETDITTLEVDAIANAANTQLSTAAAWRARSRAPAVRRSGARATAGADRARRGGRDDRRRDAVRGGSSTPRRWSSAARPRPTSSARATACTLRKADELGARSLALVAFGTGVGGFPLAEAARIEVDEVRRHLGGRQPASSGSCSRSAGDEARAAFERAVADAGL